MFGLGHHGNSLYPMLNVTATLSRPRGETFWRQTEYVLPWKSEGLQGYAFERYLAEPELLRAGFRDIARIVSSKLLDSLAPPQR